MPKKPDSVAVLRVELLGIEPLVWRRVRVPTAMTLRDLHGVLQTVMGWQDCHLHEFRVGDALIGIVDQPELDTPENMADERSWSVSQVVRSGVAEFEYVYDFGDHWAHRLILEPATRSRVPGTGALWLLGPSMALRPSGPPSAVQNGGAVLVAGEGACPPEDVGGAPGYAQFLEALADASHSEHKTYVDWVGGVWDVKGFDLNRVNRELRAPSSK